MDKVCLAHKLRTFGGGIGLAMSLALLIAIILNFISGGESATTDISSGATTIQVKASVLSVFIVIVAVLSGIAGGLLSRRRVLLAGALFIIAFLLLAVQPVLVSLSRGEMDQFLGIPWIFGLPFLIGTALLFIAYFISHKP